MCYMMLTHLILQRLCVVGLITPILQVGELRCEKVGKQESSDLNPDLNDPPNHALSRAVLSADTLDSESGKAGAGKLFRVFQV